ncbi:MAG: hypothetical protein HZB65_02745 [Candidatus Aenigmarchaeota archaeon]|nr:hypothetical protein [Candidatus Aenigmarchaeota archaeon]
MNNRLHSYETSPEKTGICEYAKQGLCSLGRQNGLSETCLAYLTNAVNSKEARDNCMAASDIYISAIETYDTAIQQLILLNPLEEA